MLLMQGHSDSNQHVDTGAPLSHHSESTEL
jgi:hypothetical protein